MPCARRFVVILLGFSAVFLYTVVDLVSLSSPISQPTARVEGDAGKRVVSFSLYGGVNPRYTIGAIANADLLPTIYPGWEMRVYHDDSVPKIVLDNLRPRPDVTLVDMQNTTIKNERVWRFLVASDPTVQCYVVRDVDSRLSKREKAAVDEWIDLGTKFHVMRDHPSHSQFAMSAGMWGGTREAIPNMEAQLNRYNPSTTFFGDTIFLNSEVWPIARESLVQHDSFSCGKFSGGKTLPFPTKRIGGEHVGGVYIDGKMRQDDVDKLLRTGVVEKCAKPTVG